MSIYYNQNSPEDAVSALQDLATAGQDAAKKAGQLVVITQSKAIDGAANAETAEHIVFRAVRPMIVTKCSYIPDDALDAHDTNYATLTVYVRSPADVGQAQDVMSRVTTKITGSGSWLAMQAVDLGSPALPNIGDGNYLTCEILKAGAGVVVPSGIFQIEGYLV